MSLYAEWYSLIPVRDAAEDIGKAMSSVIMKLAENGSYVGAKELMGEASSEPVGRRAVHLLCDTGLIRSKYVVDDATVTFDEAIAAKDGGKKIAVYFRKAFSRENQP